MDRFVRLEMFPRFPRAGLELRHLLRQHRENVRFLSLVNAPCFCALGSLPAYQLWSSAFRHSVINLLSCDACGGVGAVPAPDV